MIRYLLLSCLFMIHSSTPAQEQEFFWVKLGTGVEYSVAYNGIGNNIFIGFGGWRTEQKWVNTWLEALYASSLKELNIKHIFSVKGPDDVCYSNKETDLLKLANYVTNILRSNYFYDTVIVAAHSSGSFVAHELFDVLYGQEGIASDSSYDNRIIYFNLDGGTGSSTCGTRITKDIAKKLQKIYAVAVFDSSNNIYSQNINAMRELADSFGEKSEQIILNGNTTGCHSPGCLHSSVIIKSPHDPTIFKLESDYTTFSPEKPVQDEYLRVLRQKPQSKLAD